MSKVVVSLSNLTCFKVATIRYLLAPSTYANNVGDLTCSICHSRTNLQLHRSQKKNLNIKSKNHEATIRLFRKHELVAYGMQ